MEFERHRHRIHVSPEVPRLFMLRTRSQEPIPCLFVCLIQETAGCQKRSAPRPVEGISGGSKLVERACAAQRQVERVEESEQQRGVAAKGGTPPQNGLNAGGPYGNQRATGPKNELNGGARGASQ